MSNSLTHFALPLIASQSDIDGIERVDHSARVSFITKLLCESYQNSNSPWTIVQLLPGDFELLMNFLKTTTDKTLVAFFQQEFRWDYFSQSLRFIIRMPSYLHEAVCQAVTVKIYREIETSNANTAAYVENVMLGGSPTLKFPSDKAVEGNREGKEWRKYDSHAPDASFFYKNTHWPCVVMEVSYSQKRKDLKYLADNYILGSNGDISVMIGLDIEYEKSKRATLSVWRSQYVVKPDGQKYLVAAQTVVDQEFSDHLGNPTPNPHQGLELRLKDFLNPRLVKDHETMTNRIFISSKTLHSILLEARTLGNESGDRGTLAPGAKKMERQKTPPQEVSPDDERQYAREEEEAEARSESRDEDYDPLDD